MSRPAAIEIETPFLRLAGIAHGSADGRPVLALHGWLDNAASFDFLAPLIAPTLHLDFIALDFPGHGLSDHRPPGINQYFVDNVPIIARAIRALGWNRVSLIGHSMGGGVCSLLAGTFPELIERVVLIDALGPMADDPEDAPARLQQSILYDIEKSEGGGDSQPLYRNKERAIRSRRRAGNLSEQSAGVLVERNLEEVEGGFCWRTDPRLKTPSAVRLTENQVTAFLRRIQAPVLLLAAEDSQYRDGFEKMIRERIQAIANIQVQYLPGGHHLHMENPEPVAEHIRAFFEGESTDEKS
ncbi:MAG: alpha/beta hydrolase [Leptospiraceae bacterium]|nr:alpha/beta hydrolase [Leptospiraceae bacterium]